MKLIGLNWRELHEIKDYVDAALCAMTAMAYDSGYAEEIKADDGTIYLLSTKFPYEIKRKITLSFILKDLNEARDNSRLHCKFSLVDSFPLCKSGT
jgi:Uncharacterized conserved protein